MRLSFFKLTGFAAVFALLGLACVPAFAQERAHTKAPADDACYLLGMPGMLADFSFETLAGETMTINEGLVIRQSYIRDGKIVIPPSGLYLSSRSGRSQALNNEVYTIAGLPYYLMNDTYERIILKDLTMRLGQTVWLDDDHTRAFQLTDFSTNSVFMDGVYTATFKILKPSGNYYGNAFEVGGGPNNTDLDLDNALVHGSGFEAGLFVPTVENTLGHLVFNPSVASVGRSWVVIDDINATNVHVLEFSTEYNTSMWLSDKEPVIGLFSAGDTLDVHGQIIEVLAVSADSVTLKYGEQTQTLGPVNPESTKYLNPDTTARNLFMFVSEDNSLVAHLNVMSPDGAFIDGKANLVAYADVVAVKAGDNWQLDPRFILRPDT